MNIKWFDINTVFFQEKLEILRIMCYDLIKQETDTIKQKIVYVDEEPSPTPDDGSSSRRMMHSFAAGIQ